MGKDDRVPVAGDAQLAAVVSGDDAVVAQTSGRRQPRVRCDLRCDHYSKKMLSWLEWVCTDALQWLVVLPRCFLIALRSPLSCFTWVERGGSNLN